MNKNEVNKIFLDWLFYKMYVQVAFLIPVAGCTMLAAAPNARFFCSVFGKDPPTGI